MEHLKKYSPLLMFSCKRTSELINKREISPLTLKEKLILFYHHSICEACQHYKIQSHKIDTVFLNLFIKTDHLEKLTTEKKQNIISKIKDLD
jgi:hypothetical protein